MDYPDLVTVERHHYSVTGEIAKGGMGRVLAARDLRLGRDVAIKELLPRNRDLARRFEREARITARLQHPSIIHVYEAGMWGGGEPFYAMTRVVGRSLDKVVTERSTLNDRIALLPNVIAVVDALAYAHSQKVIHRDLKPANVLVGNFGETVVIDWGLAKDLVAPVDPRSSMQIQLPTASVDTGAGSIVGTPAYMPPEQARGHSVDQRADVYALGALLYHVLAGVPPYTGPSSKEVLAKVASEPPTPLRDHEPGVPADLVAIVAKAMARETADRYGDASELALDLKRFQTGQLVAAHHYTRAQLFWRWLRRHRVAVVSSTVFAVALVTVALVLLTRIFDDGRRDHQQRNALLDERGRSELLAGNAGKALAYLVEAGDTTGAHGFMIAEAARAFDAQVGILRTGDDPAIVAHSAMANLVAVARGDVVELWHDETLGLGTPVGTLDAPHARVITFDPTGAYVVTAGDDHMVRMWTVAGKLVGAVGPAPTKILDATVSPDGRLIATGGADGDTRVWRVDGTGSTSCFDQDDAGRPRPCHRGDVVGVRFSPDGHRIAAASDDGTASVWNVETGVLLAPLRHNGAVNSVRWTRNGKLVVTASADGTAGVWIASDDGDQPKRGKPWCAPLGHLDGPAIMSVELDADDRVLIATASGVAEIWELPELASDDLTKPATLLATFAGHHAAVEQAVFSRDGAVVATAGRDLRATVWDVTTGRPIAAFEHASRVDSVAFDRDGSRLITAGADGVVRSWAVTGRSERIATSSQAVHAIAVGPDGSAVVGAANGSVSPVSGGAKLFQQLGAITALAYSRTGTLVAVGSDREGATLWRHGARIRLAPETPEASALRAVAISDDGNTIVTGGDDGFARVWSVDDSGAHLAWSHAMSERRAAVTAVALAHDGRVVAVDAGGLVAVWTHTGERTGMNARMAGGGRALAVSPDGAHVAVAEASSVAIFALGSAIPEVRLDGPFEDLRAVAFADDGVRLLTGGRAGRDGVVGVWDAATGRLLGTRVAPHAPIESLALSPDGRVVWAAGNLGNATALDDPGVIHAWDIHVESRPLADLVALVMARVPWRLTADGLVETPAGAGDGKR